MALLAHLDTVLRAVDKAGPGTVKLARQVARHVRRASKLAADVTAALDLAAKGAEQFAELARGASSKAREARTIDVKVVSGKEPARGPQNSARPSQDAKPEAARAPQPGGNRVRIER